MYLAAGWCGGVIVPLNIRWSALENEDALKDCRAVALVVDKAFAATGAVLAQAIPSLTLIYADDGEVPAGMQGYEDLIAAHAPIPDAMRKAEDLAGIFYTGGTTGRSKGVMLSHGNLMANALNALGEGLFPGTSVYLHAAPMFHLANGAAMYSLLLSGGSNVMIPSFTPEGVMQAMQNDRVTDVLLVPTMIQMFVDHPALKNYDLSSLKNIVYGASPISEAVLARASAALPNVQFTQAYGMTELSPIATLLHWKEHIGEGKAKGRQRAAGRATLGCEVRIVDAEDRTVPYGTVGEICVRGDNVMMGYWERPEETARALAGGWMHTGDGGYMDEHGFVYVVDRVKDMIISGGENVYSVEVENAVAQHPAVAQCAVIGIPHEAWGEQVHAVVVTKAGATVTADELIAHCKALIAGYKCPRSVEITETPLPLSGAGKILKRELRQPYWENRERRVS
ncbi:long-chain acyl-CoA synthetase [Rhodopseudomonas thermotolerans]|uniref:3-methylmercaptopropionyl-CoA ligase n=3 Tax=Nitrobacteraceae TaxID=41294 RepID=A0A336JKD7_9BRAD|nr:long-chain acyl-CoA synthetase [Rhodopseudomonas pentothenatexigens]REG07377.1 long-chain acyl-CoA synthetase [Rhodopseudomonas thermotolerans]SSW89273.1 long-chain acyl-CoA synthetase [Rhodopseudomonas pentothenatexigens]